MISFASELVRASAGSGKTHKLTDRYIQLLLAKQKPEEILATTFTRKAAFEIRERVIERLLHCSYKNSAIHFSDGTVLQPSVAITMLRQMLDQQHRVAISTLDSFFIQLFSCFAFELGFSDQWSVLSNAETDELFRAVAFEVSATEDPGTLRSLLSEAGGGYSSRSVVAPLLQALQQMHEVFLENGDESAWIWLDDSPMASLDEQQLIEKVQQLAIPLNKDGSIKKRWRDEKEAWLSCIGHLPLSSLLGKGIAEKVVNGELSYDRVEIDPEWFAAAEELIKQAGDDERTKLKRRMSALYAMVSRLDKGLASQLLARGVMRFSDVKSVLVKVFDRGLVPDDLMYRLDCSYKHLLFDEFQDTSQREFDLLRPFVQEKLAQHSAGEQHSFYCVGDSKQAIYGWRGGAVGLFTSMDEQFAEYPMQISSIDSTRRCSPNVLALVNGVFATLQKRAGLWGDSGFDIAAHWQAVYQPHGTDISWHSSPGYSSLRCLTMEHSDDDKQGALIAATVQAVSSIVDVDAQGDIAVICRSNSMVAGVLAALRSEGFDVAEEGGGKLLDSPLAVLIHQALTLLDNPGNTVAGLMVQQSPLADLFFGESRPGSLPCAFRLSKIRDAYFENGLYALIDSWSLRLLDLGSVRDQRRLRQVLQCAQRISMRGESIRTTSFLRQLEIEKVEELSLATRIRVMTVHQSKGLGFDHVVLPELGKKLLQPDPHSLWIERSSIGRADKVVRGVPSKVCSLLPEVAAIRDSFTAFQTNEELCVLYVALTRAKKSVHCVVAEKKQEPSSGAPTIGQLIWMAMEEIAEHREISELGNQYHCGLMPEKVGGVHSQMEASLVEVKGGAIQVTNTEMVRYSGHVKSTKKVSPSKPTRLLHKENGYLPPKTASIQFGVAVHRVLAGIQWLDTMDVSAVAGDEAHTFVDRALKRPAITALFSEGNFGQQGSSVRAFPEYRYSFLLDEVEHTGSMDRLVLRERAGKAEQAWIIDFKVGQSGDRDIGRYDTQLENYRKAISHLFSLPLATIQCMVVFMGDGVIRTIGG
jgi:ATP-dependent helicase/nuclease subunit A